MVLLFYTFNEMKFLGLWNHSDFITLVTIYQPQNSHSSNATGFREKKNLTCHSRILFWCLSKSEQISSAFKK